MSWIERPPPCPRSRARPRRTEGGSLEARAAIVFKAMAVIGFAGIALSLLPDLDAQLVAPDRRVQPGPPASWRPCIWSRREDLIEVGRGRSAPRGRSSSCSPHGAPTRRSRDSPAAIIRIPFELVMVVWAFRGPADRTMKPHFSGRGFGAARRRRAAARDHVVRLPRLRLGRRARRRPTGPRRHPQRRLRRAGRRPAVGDHADLRLVLVRDEPAPERGRHGLHRLGRAKTPKDARCTSSGMAWQTTPRLEPGQRGQLGLSLVEEARAQAPRRVPVGRRPRASAATTRARLGWC